MSQISRTRASELGHEALRILEAGHYRTEAGAVVELGDLLRRAVEETRSYPPDELIPGVEPGLEVTRIEVANESTLAAARRLIDEGSRPVALNFASAKHPGGGFLSGARAQEESLARSSGLYACLAGSPMYEYHRAQGDPMYSGYAIYSPDVPVFRADDGSLLDRPYACSFITAPAVNARVVLERDPSRRPEIGAAMRARVDRVLAIAASHGHDAAVLGAWGCGVFGNDGREVAGLFRRALDGGFRGVFSRVIFAILDWSEDGNFIGPFQTAFGLPPG
jgi:uncharacterized protein (TIGR02452 family)